jgi:hypothetical protein
MKADKGKNLISLRQGDGETLKSDLIRLADDKKWSLNLYATEVLRDHVKKSKPQKEKKQ